MKKEIISIFIFSFFLFACAQKAGHSPLPLPEPALESASVASGSLSEIPRFDLNEIDNLHAESETGPRSSTTSEDEHFDMEERALDNSLATAPTPEESVTPPEFLPPDPPRLEARVRSISLPDLAITKLWLTPQRRLAIMMANLGDDLLPKEFGNLKIFVDGRLKGSYPLKSLSNQSPLSPKESFTFATPLTIIGRREIHAFVEVDQGIRERNRENNRLKKVLEGLPIGPDILVKDLDLTEDFDLIIILSNRGEGDLRKGTTLRIRIDVNHQKISEFDHFVSEPLKANFGNQYVIDPPYAVKITRSSKVKVSIFPKSPYDDIRLINNTLEKNFLLFPFRIEAKGRQEFSFPISLPRSKDGNALKKILKAEVRWDGGGTPLMLSSVGIPPTTGKSPLKVDVPILFEPEKKKVWKVAVTSFLEKRVEGHLIIRHP